MYASFLFGSYSAIFPCTDCVDSSHVLPARLGARGAAEFEGVVLPPRAELERLEYTVNTLKESLRRCVRHLAMLIVLLNYHPARFAALCINCPCHVSLIMFFSFGVRYTLVPVVSRVCVEDDMLGDQPVPAGTKIFMLIKAVHMNPDLWPDPDAFRPERFEKEFEMCVHPPFAPLCMLRKHTVTSS